MKKILIASFSQTGSTRKVADLIAKGLNSSDCEITHHNISGSDIPNIETYDIIGIGSPTYFFRPPFIVMDFVNKLAGLKNKSSFVFISKGTHSGDCGNWIRRTLIRKGSRDLGYFKSYGRDYWLGYIKRGVLFSPDSPSEKELASAEEFGKALINRYSDANMIVEPFDPSTPVMYGIERMLVARPFAKLMYSKTFRASSECNSCGICIKKCPVSNISEKKDGTPKWNSNCMLCATCELICPKDAVHSAFDWMIFTPFMRYNIRNSKKKQIPYSFVEHSGGKTHVI
jgi:flavodoxin/Pyruvate/2-oxoacid:ferredoxin oxidoreductase delta subunit